MGRFTRPRVQGGVQRGARVWTLSYALPPRAPSIAGQSTAITINEFPRLRSGAVTAGPDTVQIHGKRVRIRHGNPQIPTTVATWVTPHASYVVLDNGKTLATVRQLVACLP